MTKKNRILAINPGSTSTKIALFNGETVLFSITLRHDASQLALFDDILDQLPYRRDLVLDALQEAGESLECIDAFVGRGGSIYPCKSGVYEVDERLLEDTRNAVNGVRHPANLGVLIAHELARRCGKRCFTVNPPPTDEFIEKARITGIKGIYRASHLHALNMKETAIRHAVLQGQRYEECNYIVCHIGGGISVSAHRKGRMIDGNDISGGEGPIAPTRCGTISCADLLDYMEEHTAEEVRSLCISSGGLVDLLGTSDAAAVYDRVVAGDPQATLVWEAMVYQIVKYIGAMSTALSGRVNAILLGGGMVFNKALVAAIRDACGWIAAVYAYPGEFEMEALAAGANRALNGTTAIEKYTGKPIWSQKDAIV